MFSGTSEDLCPFAKLFHAAFWALRFFLIVLLKNLFLPVKLCQLIYFIAFNDSPKLYCPFLVFCFYCIMSQRNRLLSQIKLCPK